MKKLTITLPEDYEVPENIAKLEPDEWMNVIIFMSSLLESNKGNNDIKKQLSSLTLKHEKKLKDNEMKHKLEIEKLEYEFKNKHEIKIIKLETMLENKNYELSNVLKKEEMMIKQYEERINEHKIMTDKLSQSYNNELQNKNELIDKIVLNTKRLDEINNTIKPVCKLFNESNDEKEDTSEEFITNLLSCNGIYNECEVRRTSKEHKGNIIFSWGELVCLIEVKNKNTLTNINIKKFKDDIITNTYNKSINCGLFISFKSDKFPTLSHTNSYKIDYIVDTPVIYLQLKTSDMLENAIFILKSLIQNKTMDNQHTKIYKESFKEYEIFTEDMLMNIKNELKNIDRRKKELEVLRDKCTLRITNINKCKENLLKNIELNDEDTINTTMIRSYFNLIYKDYTNLPDNIMTKLNNIFTYQIITKLLIKIYKLLNYRHLK